MPKKKVATARHTGNIKLNEPPDRQTPATSGPKINRSIPKPVKKTESAIQLPEKKLSVKSKKETERKAAAPTKPKTAARFARSVFTAKTSKTKTVPRR